MALLMRELHQPLSEVEQLPLPKLFMLANLAAGMSGKTFE